MLQRGEHAEPEQVELHEPHPRGIVLVPLDDGATGHARVLDRHDLADGPIGEHHAARVDAEVAGRAHDAHGVFEHLIGDVVVAARLDRGAPALDLPRPGVLLARREAEGAGDVAHGVLRAVLDDVGDLGGAVAPVLFVDPLDDLFTTVAIEVDVDVGLFIAHGREEPLERQTVVDRVDRRDAEQIADGAVRRGSAPLAEYAAPARLVHDVADDEEVAGEILLLDDIELVRDALSVVVAQARVLTRNGAPDEIAQVRHRRLPRGTLIFGSAGRAARSGKASSPARRADASTAPGNRSKRRAISSPERRCAAPVAGSHPSRSSMLRVARIAETACAIGRRSGRA